MPSFRRLLHPSSPSVSDDLADLEECFRNSSFALVPSALTPSRAPSNSIIATTRALFFNRPVRLDFASGLEKGPVSDWYKTLRAKGSTAIKKIQLRKDYQHPYYHEYIVISTRSGHTYRVDRRPDPNAPFDTIMKTGCMAYDTIQEVDSTSLKGLDNTSSCIVELRWRGKKIIDLLFVLSICFAIYNDKLADRYTLQRYNCYFLSWAIIGITMRKSAVRGAVFNTVGLGRGQGMEMERELELELALELEPERARALGLGQALGRALGRERVRELQLELQQWQQRERELGRERERAWARARASARAMALERARERAGERTLELGRVRERTLELELDLERARAQRLEQAQEWAHGLGQIPLGLGPIKNFALAKTVPSSLKESCMIIVRYMTEDRTKDQYQIASDLADFPTSFSVLLNDDSGPVKSKAPHRTIRKPAELERHIVEVIERHATRVARWGLGSSAEVKSDILAGIWRTWEAMSMDAS